MSYQFKKTDEFGVEFNKLPVDIRKRFENQFRKVEENPFSLGKPLGYTWFRELKNGGHRVYYLIYENKIIVLFVGVSGKKDQQSSINIIKSNLPFFKEFIEKE